MKNEKRKMKSENKINNIIFVVGERNAVPIIFMMRIWQLEYLFVGVVRERPKYGG